MDKIAILQEKLVRLREMDVDFKIFGSGTHRYIMNPCLTEYEIAEFENKHRIQLPEDYRNFLLDMGNGGAGPGYSLWELSHYWGLRDHGESKNFPDFLASPFPHTEKWNLSYKAFEDELAFDTAYFKREFIQGSVGINHYGCCIVARLVISGEERGHIWIDDRGSDYGIHPCWLGYVDDHVRASPVRVDFFTWYNHWLDESLAKLNG